MNLIIFIVVVIIIAVLPVRIIFRRSKNCPPALIRLHAAGIRPGEAERILVSGEYWQRQKTLLTEKRGQFHERVVQDCGYEAVVSVPAGTGR